VKFYSSLNLIIMNEKIITQHYYIVI